MREFDRNWWVAQGEEPPLDPVRAYDEETRPSALLSPRAVV